MGVMWWKDADVFLFVSVQEKDTNTEASHLWHTSNYATGTSGKHTSIKHLIIHMKRRMVQ